MTLRQLPWRPVLAALALCESASGAEPTHLPPADDWLTNTVVRSAPYDFSSSNTNGFESLHAEVLTSRLKIIFLERAPDSHQPPSAIYSIEPPGHWPARDWTAEPMVLRNGIWERAVPVEDLDVPVVYFLRLGRPGINVQSALRLCRPRLAGLEQPTRLFWPFLEGFENGAGRWSLIAAPGDPAALGLSEAARTGRAALRVELIASRHSATVATSLVRGETLARREAMGLRLWLRAAKTPARARFTLIADAFTTNQVVSVSSLDIQLQSRWEPVNLPLDSFPRLPVSHVDRFIIEFVSDPPNEFFVDDLQFLGPWKPDSE